MKMAVLLSGSGRTLDNFHQRLAAGTMGGSIEVVVSNVADALGLSKAKQYGYRAMHAADNGMVNAILSRYGVELVLLAGYLKLYQPPEHLSHSVLNVHPSLIPAFCGAGMYGMRVHRAVKARGVKVSGCTVHFANEVYDEGPIVVQKCVALADQDTPEDIAARVFALECESYPEAVNMVLEKGVEYFWKQG